MAVSQPWMDVIYINCQPNSPFDDKNGEKISSIIDYTLKEMSNPESGSSAEGIYQHYCKTLRNKLGLSNEFDKTEQLKELTKDTIINTMKNCLSHHNDHHHNEKIYNLIEKAADEVAVLISNTNTKKELYKQNKIENVASEFVVLMIFKATENLQLVPCYMAVKENITDCPSNSTSEFFMDYKHKKFILSKDNIEKTINDLQHENKCTEVSEKNQIGDRDLCNEWVYENCQPNSLIETQKVSSIVNYAMKAMGISVSPSNAEESFKYYCTALENRLKSSEPYYASTEINEMKKDVIIKNLKQLLPQEEKFDGIIEKAATIFEPGINAKKKIKKDKNVISSDSEFAMLRILKSNENLELIPCYMVVKEVKEETKGIFFNSSISKFFMDYKQQKFILSKFDVKGIIKKLQGEAKTV
jgi:hypothetical protein